MPLSADLFQEREEHRPACQDERRRESHGDTSRGTLQLSFEQRLRRALAVRDGAQRQAAGERIVNTDHRHQFRTSTLTLGEILVKPLERGDDAVYRRYEEASLACAAQVRADLFLTNDERVSQSP